MAVTGSTVLSLEHHEEWREKVLRALHLAGVHARVELSPPEPYEHSVWYQLPEQLPESFDLVLCDGPPSTTQGGRSGLWRLIGDRIRCCVLLDDAGRDGERTLLAELEQSGWHVSVQGRHALVCRQGTTT
jgi:hypothetical protein